MLQNWPPESRTTTKGQVHSLLEGFSARASDPKCKCWRMTWKEGRKGNFGRKKIGNNRTYEKGGGRRLRRRNKSLMMGRRRWRRRRRRIEKKSLGIVGMG